MRSRNAAGARRRVSAPARSCLPLPGCLTAAGPRPTGSGPTNSPDAIPRSTRGTGNAPYVADGPVITSAGTAAGIDACLHLLRLEHGAAVANAVARRMVVPPHRDGGQAQYIPVIVEETEDRRTWPSCSSGRCSTCASRSAWTTSLRAHDVAKKLRSPVRGPRRDHAASVADRPAAQSRPRNCSSTPATGSSRSPSSAA